MEKKLMFLASFILVVLVENSEGIECYSCGPGTSCNDPFVKGENYLKTCRGDVSCMKYKVERRGAQAVERSCHFAKMNEGCPTAHVEGVAVDICYCNSNGCNPAVTTKLSTGVLVFISLAYILCRVF